MIAHTDVHVEGPHVLTNRRLGLSLLHVAHRERHELTLPTAARRRDEIEPLALLAGIAHPPHPQRARARGVRSEVEDRGVRPYGDALEVGPYADPRSPQTGRDRGHPLGRQHPLIELRRVPDHCSSARFHRRGVDGRDVPLAAQPPNPGGLVAGEGVEEVVLVQELFYLRGRGPLCPNIGLVYYVEGQGG